MQKNRTIFLTMLMMGVWLYTSLMPNYASAATSPAVPTSLPTYLKTIPTNGIDKAHICPGPDAENPDKGFATRLIPCIRNTVIFVATNLITPLSGYFADTIMALITLSIVVWGALVAAGNPTSISRNGIILAVKIGFVLMFTNSFANYYPTFLESIESILALIVKPIIAGSTLWMDTSPSIPGDPNSAPLCKINDGQYGYVQATMTIWHVLDCYLELFIGGIFSKTTLLFGILGVIIAAIFSGPVGYFVALAGLYMLLIAVYTIARCMYIFITSYIAFSFMVMISFMFIPMILFQSTKKYFDGWLQLTISFILQPIFLLSYLILFLVAFNSVIFHGPTSLYYTIAGKESDDDGFRIGKWIDKKGGWDQVIVAKSHTEVHPGQALKTLAARRGVAPELKINIVPALTGVAGIQGARPEELKKHELETSNKNGNLASFFKTGIVMKSINWHNLAIAAYPQEWADCACTSDDYPEDVKKREEFHNEYKIKIFLAFMMATIFMYLFYSLLGYIPYIGSSIAGGGGMTLGSGLLSMPGSNLFGGGKK